MSLLDFLKFPHYEIVEDDRNCGNCYYERIMKCSVDEYPCNDCDIGKKPIKHWKDWRLE